MEHPLLASLPIETSHGRFVAHYSKSGLAKLSFPHAKLEKAEPSASIPSIVRQWHVRTIKAIKAILAGSTPAELPPFDVSRGTEFQRRVWEELTWTPCGEIRSYGDIAKAVRRPKAVRAVGGACGANPIPLLIPCHRVLAADRKIGGFSGGLDWKRKLLGIEGVDVR